jgi:2-keto-3-deoxy-L-rhamnonate aldolase RhmA
MADQEINPVKRKLRNGETVIACTITIPNADVAMHAARLGFDFLWIEMEHSPITLESLRNMVLATRGLPTLPFARVPVNELWTAKRVLDAGVFGAIFPFTTTPELAAQAAAACKYPPVGRRGAGASLARFAWPQPEEYMNHADDNIVVIAMIEEACAVDRIDEIAATPGIDALFIGTSDLSFSLGLRGKQDHETLDAAIAKIVESARRHGKPIGRPAGTPEHIDKFKQQGFTLFQGPTDLGFMMSGAKKYLG